MAVGLAADMKIANFVTGSTSTWRCRWWMSANSRPTPTAGIRPPDILEAIQYRALDRKLFS
jgi:hypothetical protein